MRSDEYNSIGQRVGDHTRRYADRMNELIDEILCLDNNEGFTQEESIRIAATFNLLACSIYYVKQQARLPDDEFRKAIDLIFKVFT